MPQVVRGGGPCQRNPPPLRIACAGPVQRDPVLFMVAYGNALAPAWQPPMMRVGVMPSRWMEHARDAQGGHTMAGGDKLNGSVDLLAKAMRQVFQEAVEGAVEPIADQVKALRTDTHDLKTEVSNLRTDMDERFERVETDMQNGFAELRPPEADDATRSGRGT